MSHERVGSGGAAATKFAGWFETLPPAHRESFTRSLAATLLAGFTPLERDCLRADPSRLERVAIARLDMFVTEDGRARALELNTRIPAMQGYSDILTRRWIEAVARERGLDVARTRRLVERTATNTADLLASLVCHYHASGGAARAPR